MYGRSPYIGRCSRWYSLEFVSSCRRPSAQGAPGRAAKRAKRRTLRGLVWLAACHGDRCQGKTQDKSRFPVTKTVTELGQRLVVSHVLGERAGVADCRGSPGTVSRIDQSPTELSIQRPRVQVPSSPPFTRRPTQKDPTSWPPFSSQPGLSSRPRPKFRRGLAFYRPQGHPARAHVV